MKVCNMIHSEEEVFVIYSDYDCPLCAAKKQIAELKARLNYIRNGNSEVFIPPENSTNRGED